MRDPNGSVFTHLRAEINWHQLFMELIAGFDLDAPGAPTDRGAAGAKPVPAS